MLKLLDTESPCGDVFWLIKKEARALTVQHSTVIPSVIVLSQ